MQIWFKNILRNKFVFVYIEVSILEREKNCSSKNFLLPGHLTFNGQQQKIENGMIKRSSRKFSCNVSMHLGRWQFHMLFFTS